MTIDPILTAARRLFSPGPPTFDALSPTTYGESLQARARCCFCSSYLAPRDRIACTAHRLELDFTPFEPAPRSLAGAAEGETDD